MTKPQALDLLMLLSALESWAFSRRASRRLTICSNGLMWRSPCCVTMCFDILPYLKEGDSNTATRR